MPEIVVVEDIPSTPPPPPLSSRDITSAKRHSTGFSWVEPETPTRSDQFGPSSDLSPFGGSTGSSSASSPWRGLRRDRRESDMSALSADLGLRHTYVAHDSTFNGFGSMLTGHLVLLGATCLRSVTPRRSRSRMIMTCLRQYRTRRGAVSFLAFFSKGFANASLFI